MSKNHEHSHWQPSHVLSQIFTFQDCQVGAVTALVVWLSSPLGGGIHDTSSIRKVPGSLLSDYGKPRICRTCQLRYENVVWPHCIKFHTLPGHIVTREGLHHCQTYAALWFNRSSRNSRTGTTPSGDLNCGPGPSRRGAGTVAERQIAYLASIIRTLVSPHARLNAPAWAEVWRLPFGFTDTWNRWHSEAGGGVCRGGVSVGS